MPVQVARRSVAPRDRHDEGLVSYHLTTMLLEIASGGERRLHSHAPEQIDLLLEGVGVMTVGDDRR